MTEEEEMCGTYLPWCVLRIEVRKPRRDRIGTDDLVSVIVCDRAGNELFVTIPTEEFIDRLHELYHKHDKDNMARRGK